MYVTGAKIYSFDNSLDKIIMVGDNLENISWKEIKMMTRDDPAYAWLKEKEQEDDQTADQAEPTITPLFSPDPDWYEEPLVEDSFGQPIFGDLVTSSPIFHAAIPPFKAPTRWDGVWAGIGCMSDNGLPFDSLEMAIGLVILARRLRCPASLLIADAHALTTDSNETKIHSRAERLRGDIDRIFKNIGFRCKVFLASSLRNNSDHQAFFELVDGWERHLELELPPYLKLGMADSAFMASKNQLKVGWSTSAAPNIDEGRYHEPATDLRARHLQCHFGGIYTRPGFTLNGERPKAVPYTERDAPDERLMLTGGRREFNYRDQIARSNRSAKGLKKLEERIGLITGAFDCTFGQLDGDCVFHKAESLARLAAAGL